LWRLLKSEMAISLITTVLNEEKTIKQFLNSVLKQTKRPDEFIIVDGGSKDKTYEILREFGKKYGWIKAYLFNGALIGEGRNFGIKKSKCDIIAITDAGCFLDENWLKEITKPFSENKHIDVVIGTYKPHSTNDFEYFQGLVGSPDSGKIFMKPSRMSTRSMAFKKTAWEKVGGFAKKLGGPFGGEDTQFNMKLIENKSNFYFAQNAIVYWRMHKSFKKFASQFYRYAVGDRKSGNIFKLRKNLLFILGFWFYIVLILAALFFNPIISASLVIFPFFYLVGYGFKIAIKSGKPTGIFYGPVFLLIKRIAYVLGASVGK